MTPEEEQAQLLEAIKALVAKVEGVVEATEGVSNLDMARVGLRLYAGPVFREELGRVREIIKDSL